MSDENLAWLKNDQAYTRRRRGGLSPAELLDMPDETRELFSCIMRHEPASPETIAQALEKETADVADSMQLLAVQGWLEIEREGEEQLYRVRLARRRKRALPPGIWQVLENSWQAPIFRAFTNELLEDFMHRFTLCRYSPGEYLFRAGEWGDTMFVVNEGIVELVTQSFKGEQVIIDQIKPNQILGEMAVLLGEKRAFDARARDEVQAWVLNKTDFEHLLATAPAAALTLRHELRRTLHTKAQESAQKAYNPAVVAGKDVKEIARHLAKLTGQMVSILDLRTTVSPGTTFSRVRHLAVADLGSKDLGREMAARLEDGDWVLLAVSAELNGSLLGVVDKIEMVIDLTGQELPWLIAASRRRWSVAPERARPDRLARRLARRTMGVALSGGMARGLAHIGVLRVLEEAGIAIDMIAGSGMGAVCGGLYAAGVPLKRLEQLAREGKLDPLVELSWRQRLGDQGAPYNNQSARETVKRLAQNQDLEALPTPFFSVATDLNSGQAVVLERGSLSDALAVALSPPGLTPILTLQERPVADGTPLNPLPTNLLQQRGADLVLASSVIPSQQALQQRSGQTDGSFDLASSLLGLYDALAQSAYLDHLNLAGVLLTPDVEEFADTAFDRAGDIIQRGEMAARQQLNQINLWIANG